MERVQKTYDPNAPKDKSPSRTLRGNANLFGTRSQIFAPLKSEDFSRN
jgi:hypothetical protein